jgi:CBS domain-containing protein
MRLTDLMITDLPRAAPDDSVRDIATYMLASHVKALPVCTGERLVGILTDWDIATAVARYDHPGDIPVGEVMSKPVLTVRPDATLEEVSHLMREYHVHHVCVSDGERFEGMVHLHVDSAGVDHGLGEAPQATLRRTP